MKLHQFVLGLLLLPATMCAKGISGNYHVKGYDPSAEPPQYEGCVRIKSVDLCDQDVAPGVHPKEYYKIHWSYSDFQSISGRGVRDGDTLSFYFEGDSDSSYKGVQVYKIHGDDELKGPWILHNGKTIGKEKLKKQRHCHLPTVE